MSQKKKSPRRLAAADLLFNQGFGSRREVEGRILQGQLKVAGEVVDDPGEVVELDGLVFEVMGQRWPYREHAYIVMNKPLGYECSQKPSTWPSVMTLLPTPLRTRGVQPLGRLDQDTSGLLLLSDDGAFIHRMTSPKKKVAKVYRAGTKHELDDKAITRLKTGVVLEDDPMPVAAADAEIVGPHDLRLTITEGKYHQVKRMIAAVSNRCESLHRERFGELLIPACLAPGQWMWLDSPDEVLKGYSAPDEALAERIGPPPSRLL